MHYSERQTASEKAKAKLEKYGHELTKRKSNLTEVFKPIKLKAEEEVVLLDGQSEEDVDSLQHFLE